MKKAILTIILLIAIHTTYGQTNTPSETSKAPVFEFETIDYGKIKQHANGYRYFRFKNIGKSPLVITKVKGSCGCTVPTKPEEPILPGKTGKIKVKYATNRIGRFSKTITISSNASEGKKVVRIKGEVLGGFKKKEIKNPVSLK